MNTKPTIVFVHGAFAESSSWSGVIAGLKAEGYPMIAIANPLRGVQYDADYLLDLLHTIEGPIVLVGHSYGGMVISNAVDGASNVIALVFVGAFAPEPGESPAVLSGRFPGGTLGDTLNPVLLADGNKDLYIQQDKYWRQFVADAPEEQASVMAVTQRPIAEVGLTGGANGAAWKEVPSWFIYGELDKNIPAAVHRFMAERANARDIIEVEGGAHALTVMNAVAVANVIRDAVSETVLAQSS